MQISPYTVCGWLGQPRAGGFPDTRYFTLPWNPGERAFWRN